MEQQHPENTPASFDPTQTVLLEDPRTKTQEQVHTVLEQREENNETLQDAVTNIEITAFQNIRQLHGLDFHNEQHTQRILQNGETLLDALSPVLPEAKKEKNKALYRIAAVCHDTVQASDHVSQGGKTMLKRHIGYNEKASADFAKTLMDIENDTLGSAIFSEEEKRIVEEAILTTVPDWDGAAGTVIQPNLTRQTPLIGKILALSDIGDGGLASYQDFLAGGDALFREENLDIKEALKTPLSLSSEQKEAFRQRMIGWSKMQVGFLRGRQKKFQEEIQLFPPNAQAILKKCFCHFEENITEAGKTATERAHMDFETLISRLGY